MEINSENILLRIRVKPQPFYTNKLESNYYLKQYS